MTAASRLAVAIFVVVTASSLSIAAQTAKSVTSRPKTSSGIQVPRDSWLYGVSVEGVALTDSQARKTGYPQDAGAARAVVVTGVSVEEGTPGALWEDYPGMGLACW